MSLMSPEEFVQQTKVALDQWLSHYKEQAEKASVPENWPMQMDYVDWVDTFMTHEGWA